MHIIKKSKVLPHNKKDLFEVVIAIEKYPEFLPYCQGAKIIEAKEGKIIADLTVGKGVFNETFRSIVDFWEYEKITMKGSGNILSWLEGSWEFIERTENSSEVQFELNLKMKHSWMQKMFNPLFEDFFVKIMNAFKKRAKY